MAGARPKNLPPRRDPVRARPRLIGFDQTKLVQANPDLKYKLVDKAAVMNGVTQHEQRGWSIVLQSKDGPQLQVGTGARPSEPVELDGHILMSLPKEEWLRVEREGQFGERGQDLLDEIDAQITDPHGGADTGLRSNRYAAVINETKPEQTFETNSI